MTVSEALANGYSVRHSTMDHCLSGEGWARNTFFSLAPEAQTEIEKIHAQCSGSVVVHSMRVMVLCNCECHKTQRGLNAT